MLFYESQSYKRYSQDIFHSNGFPYTNNKIVEDIIKRGYNLKRLGVVEDFSVHPDSQNSVLSLEEVNSYKNQYWKFVEIEAFKKVYHLATPDIRNIVDKWTTAYFEVLKLDKLIDVMDKSFKGEALNFDEISHLFGYEVAMSSYIVSNVKNFNMEHYTFYKANRLRVSYLDDEEVSKHLALLLRGTNNGYSSLLLYYAVYKYFFLLSSSITKTLFLLDRNISMIKDSTLVKSMWKESRYFLDNVSMFGSFDKTKFDYIDVYGKQYRIYKPLYRQFMVRIKGLYYEVNLEANSVRLLDFDKNQRSYSKEELRAVRRFQDFLWGDVIRVLQLFASNLKDYFDLLSKANLNPKYAPIYQDINIFKTTSIQMSRIAGLMSQGEINSDSEDLADETDFVSSQFDNFSNTMDKVELLSITMKANANMRKTLTENVNNIEDVDELLKTVAENEKLLHTTAENLKEGLGGEEQQKNNDRLTEYAKNLGKFKPSKSGNIHQALAENKKMLIKAQKLQAKMESNSGGNNLADMQVSSKKFCSNCAGVSKTKSPLNKVSKVLQGFSMRGFQVQELKKIPNAMDLMNIEIPNSSIIPQSDQCSFDLQDSSGFGPLLAGMSAFITSLKASIELLGAIVQAIIDTFANILCSLASIIKALLKIIECMLAIVLAGVELGVKALSKIASFIAKLGEDEDENAEKVKSFFSILETFEEIIASVIDAITKGVVDLVKAIEAWTPLDEVEELFDNMLAELSIEKVIEGIANLLRGSIPTSIANAVEMIVDELMRKEYLANATLNSMKLQKLYNSLVAKGIPSEELVRIMDELSKLLEKCNKPKEISDEKKAELKGKLLAKLRAKVNPKDKAKSCTGLGAGINIPEFDFDFSLPSLTLPKFNTSC